MEKINKEMAETLANEYANNEIDFSFDENYVYIKLANKCKYGSANACTKPQYNYIRSFRNICWQTNGILYCSTKSAASNVITILNENPNTNFYIIKK